MKSRREFLKKTTAATVAAPFLTAKMDFLKTQVVTPGTKRRYALVGTGTRGCNAWARPIVDTYGQHAELVALCDINRSRMGYAKKYIGTDARVYHASEFDIMIKETKPDSVIVTTTDCFHEKYMVRAMELGCDVMSEKPLVTDAAQAQRLLDAEQRTGKTITTTFNARFGEETLEIKKILDSGELGEVLSAEFQEYLNVDHGASYYRRWHGRTNFSGSLLVHKASHHFDQMNWWLGAEPQWVNAFGKVGFYGNNNTFRAKNCRSCPHKSKCDFYWDIQTLYDKGLYLSGEAEDGYLRDGCVWDPAIDTYDSMTVEVQYANDVLLSYSLNSFMPYEGQRIAFNCEKGRLDVRTYEGQSWEVPHAYEFRITKNFGETRTYGFNPGAGEHGGSDDKMRDKLFLPDQTDELNQIADSRAGVLSSLTGIAALKSIRTKERVRVDGLVEFPSRWKW